MYSGSSQTLYSSPSFAPVVMVTSVSGLSCRPQSGVYASAIAFFSRGRPLVGEYWLHSTLSKASFAAFMMNWGGLYPKKPWPRFTMGCFGEFAAASLTIDLVYTSEVVPIGRCLHGMQFGGCIRVGPPVFPPPSTDCAPIL